MLDMVNAIVELNEYEVAYVGGGETGSFSANGHSPPAGAPTSNGMEGVAAGAGVVAVAATSPFSEIAAAVAATAAAAAWLLKQAGA